MTKSGNVADTQTLAKITLKPCLSDRIFRWAKQQREEVHHMELPGVNHMGILRDFEPAKKIAAVIENLNKQLYEDEKYLDFGEYPKVEILL